MDAKSQSDYSKKSKQGNPIRNSDTPLKGIFKQTIKIQKDA